MITRRNALTLLPNFEQLQLLPGWFDADHASPQLPVPAAVRFCARVRGNVCDCRDCVVRMTHMKTRRLATFAKATDHALDQTCAHPKNVLELLTVRGRKAHT